MALFAFIGFDKLGMGALRAATRPKHLEWLAQYGDRVKAGGALRQDDGETAMGSLIVVEAASLQEARAMFDADPYALAGLWERSMVAPYARAVGSWRDGTAA